MSVPDAKGSDHRVVTVRNPSSDKLGVVLEPWGEVCELARGQVVDVRCHGSARDRLEVTVEDQNGERFLKLWSPEGGTLEAERPIDSA